MTELPGGEPDKGEAGVINPEPTQNQTPGANITGVRHNRRRTLDGVPFVDLAPGGKVRRKTDERGRKVVADRREEERLRVEAAKKKNAAKLRAGVELKDL